MRREQLEHFTALKVTRVEENILAEEGRGNRGVEKTS
jgi:hypothetical protein